MSTELPQPPSPARKFLQYLLSFILTLGVGFAPLWLSKVPGFRTILDVFPVDLQDVIPWASVLMTGIAVCVQFFAGDGLEARRLKTGFVVTFALLVGLTFALYVKYKATVIRLQVPGANAKVAYLVGSTLLPKCQCTKMNLEIRECIGTAISANPDDVAACYPREEIAARATTLSMLYLGVMFSLGLLIGLLVLKESVPKPRTSRRAPRQRP